MQRRFVQLTWLRSLVVLGGIVLIGLACGDNSTDPPLNNDPVPNFTLQDLNQNSDSFQTYISLRDYEGSVLVVYFLRGSCSICLGQWAGLAEVIDSLHAQGTTNLFAFTVNNPLDIAHLPSIRDMNINMPVLQDTLTGSQGSQSAAVGTLLNVNSSWHDLLILDGEQIVRRRSSAFYQDDIDLSTEAGRDMLKAWIEQVITTYM